MSKKVKWLILVITLAPVVGWGWYQAETWLFSVVPQSFRWMAIWIQSVLGGAGLSYLMLRKVIVPMAKRHSERIRIANIKAEIDKCQEGYNNCANNPSLLVVAAGSMARAVWAGFERFTDPILVQALKIFLLVPSEDSSNADAETRRALEVLGGLDPPAVKLKQVASGKVQKSGADAARGAERSEIFNDFSKWKATALKKTGLVLQFVGISNGKNDRPGYTSSSVFRAYPFIGLRTQVGNKVVGEVPRWVVAVLDMADDDSGNDALLEAAISPESVSSPPPAADLEETSDEEAQSLASVSG